MIAKEMSKYLTHMSRFKSERAYVKNVIYNIIIICSLFMLYSCNQQNSLPNNFEKRIVGDWVIYPNSRSSNFVMFRLTNSMDCCNVFSFKQNHQFKWDWLNRKDSSILGSCGNALSYSESSNWELDREYNLVIDKIQDSNEEKSEVKKSYRVYEFKPDTFVLQLNKVLTNAYTNLITGKSENFDTVMMRYSKQYTSIKSQH